MKEKRILILGLQKQFWQGYFIICAIKLRSGSWTVKETYHGFKTDILSFLPWSCVDL